MASGAGLIVRIRGERRFLAALFTESIVPMPRLSPVPGARVELAWVSGRVLPVVALGPAGSHLVVCHVDGEPVALSGLEVLDSGFFAADQDGVVVDGERVAPLDVPREIAPLVAANPSAWQPR